MLARLIATVAALLLACASPQAQAHVRAERVSVSFADLARAAALENAQPDQYASNPKTALPARANVENAASGKNTALSHWHVCKNWSPVPECTSSFGVTGYQKEGELYQAIARFYRPGTGTFLSRDPWEGDVNNPASLNPYLYGYGNPGSYIDPDGRIAFLSDAERYLRQTIQGYDDSINQAIKDDSGGSAFALGIGKGLASAGSLVVGGLNTASNLLAQNIYDGDTYAQARSELDANEMAVSGAIEGGHHLGRAVVTDPLGVGARAHEATVQFTVDVAMREARALAGLGEFTGEFLAAPGGGFAARGTGRLASSFGDTASAAGRLDFDSREIDAQMQADAAAIERAPKEIVEGADGAATAKPYGFKAQFWNKPVEVGGRRVYQRDDLFDLDQTTQWRENGKIVVGSNLDRMASGRAPVGKDGLPVQLHHLTQSEVNGLAGTRGSLAEIMTSFHQQNTSVLHMPAARNPNNPKQTLPRYPSFRRENDGSSSQQNREFSEYQSDYWQQRAKAFPGG